MDPIPDFLVSIYSLKYMKHLSNSQNTDKPQPILQIIFEHKNLKKTETNNKNTSKTHPL